MRVNTTRDMLRAGSIFLGAGFLGFLMGVCGVGAPGPCADLLGCLDMLLFLGFPIGIVILAAAGIRAGGQRLHRVSQCSK